MNLKRGTPKTLDKAIENAEGEAADQKYHILKDFMAQKFGVALMRAEDQKTQEVIQKLWNDLTKREAA